jgi:hypothetical protein
MTITITYKDGSVERFTACTVFETNWPEPMQITGTDASGDVATWFVPWTDVKKVGKQP